MQPVKHLTAAELAEWRRKRPSREVHTVAPLGVSDASGEVDGDSVEWEKPAPSFIRSGSAARVYLATVKRLREGWDARVRMLEQVPGVRVAIPDAERDRWIREMAEASNRRVYADVKPVRSDLAEIVRRDGIPG